MDRDPWFRSYRLTGLPRRVLAVLALAASLALALATAGPAAAASAGGTGGTGAPLWLLAEIGRAHV